MKMQDEHYREIQEAGWRRALTREEETALQEFLAAHPEARAPWTEEAALNRLLERLPVAPVSSNFTARLLQAVQSAPKERAWRQWLDRAAWWPRPLVWRVAMASVVVCAGLLSWQEFQTAHRLKMARELAGVSRLAALPPMEWLKDFDTINRISQVKVADDDLLAALR